MWGMGGGKEMKSHPLMEKQANYNKGGYYEGSCPFGFIHCHLQFTQDSNANKLMEWVSSWLFEVYVFSGFNPFFFNTNTNLSLVTT